MATESRERPRDSAPIVLVSLRWNGAPLAACAVKEGQDVVLGDAKNALAQLPPEALGCAALAVAGAGGGPHVRVPEGRVASITGPGGMRLVAGPERAALAPGEEARLWLGDFEVTVAVDRAEPPPRRRRPVAGAWLHTAVVGAVHAALLAAGARAALASSVQEEPADLDRLRGYLAAAEERTSAPDTVRSQAGGSGEGARTNGRNGNGHRAGGERRAGEAGKAGTAESRAKDRHFGAPPSLEKGTAVSAEDALAEARDFGMVSVLNTERRMGPAPMAGVSPWGGADPIAAAGGLLGRLTGESEGSSGLALSGIGEGGGGRGDGIGLGTIGTIGHADGLAGVGTGGAGVSLLARGFGGSAARGMARPRWSGVIRCYFGDPATVSGRLPAETIRRILRANAGRFRACYEDGLRRRPGLAGRVSTRFVIGLDGAVSTVSDAGSDLPDASVTACVHRAFYGISFPQPEGGIVGVVYPISFSPE